MSESDNRQTEKEVYTLKDLLDKQGYFVYTNISVSMLPLLRQRRDLIEIRKKQGRCKKYDVVLYTRGEKYILHRVVKVRDRDYVILGDNCVRREYGVTDGMILGVMTRVIRDGKSIYTTDWKYRLYVHLWCDLYPVRIAILLCRKYARAAVKKVLKLLGNIKDSKKES